MSVRRVLTVIGVVGAVSAVTAPAYAWDCIRVSSSPQGLQSSAKSGQWEYLTFADLVQGGLQSGDIDATQVDCVTKAWTDLGEPTSFAIGGGVAGAKGAMTSGHITDTDFFELAKNAPVKIMVNGKGVDHLDDALMMIVAGCPSTATG